jgi:uncharacterized protein (DUF1778 family)
MAKPADEALTFERKSERLELRTTPSALEVIQHAMACSGLSAGDLAYEGARRILEDHERMALMGADREAFLQALATPAKPTQRLAAAMKRRRTLG